MSRISSFFPLVLQIILFAHCVRGNEEAIKHELNTVKRIYSLKQNLNISNVIGEILQLGSTENYDCFNELSAITNGLTNLEEWAIKLVDAWGSLPSGLLSGNRNSLGSFSECFHIRKNGKNFKTQYCFGQLKLPSHDDPNKIDNNWSIFHDDSTISVGICLPASCSVDRLEYAINEVIQRKFSDVRVAIPKPFCQFQEKETQFDTFDLYIIGFLGVVLVLVIASTSYDIFYTLYHRNKHPLFETFSIYKNGMKLFSRENNNVSDVIGCLKGIRVMSTVWLIYIHINNVYALLPLQEITLFHEFLGSYRGKFASLPISVDTFLAISGLLTAKKMFNMLNKNGKLNIFSLYLDRYMRLTPFLCVCFLITMALLRFMGSGPVWPITAYFSGGCSQYWWSLLLHVQNYVNPNQICYITSWYLSVDIQLYLIAPVIVYSIHRYRAKAIVALFGVILASVGCTLAVHAKYNLRNLLEARFVELSYSPTHLRCAPWLIGFITGYILLRFPNGSIRIPKILNVCGWTLSLAVLATSIFSNFPFFGRYPTHTSIMLGLYFATTRITWSIALCYIIFACSHNAGGPFNWFLSHSYWELFSKLSYAIYLTHYPILLITIFTTKASLDFSELTTLHYLIGIFVLTFLVSIVATLAFEIPIENIYKLITKSKNVSKKQNNLNRKKN